LSDVELEVFLRFNKIRALVDNTKLLAKALSKSQVLQVYAHGIVASKISDTVDRCNFVYSVVQFSTKRLFHCHICRIHKILFSENEVFLVVYNEAILLVKWQKMWADIRYSK